MPLATSSCGVCFVDAAHVAVEMEHEALGLHDAAVRGRGDHVLQIEPVGLRASRRRQLPILQHADFSRRSACSHPSATARPLRKHVPLGSRDSCHIPTSLCLGGSRNVRQPCHREAVSKRAFPAGSPHATSFAMGIDALTQTGGTERCPYRHLGDMPRARSHVSAGGDQNRQHAD